MTVLAALLLLPIGAAAGAASTTASFSFREAAITSADALNSTNLTTFQLPPGPGSFQWSVAAEAITVNWTVERYHEVGKPPDFREQYYTSRVDGSSGETRYHEAAANGSSKSSASGLIGFDDGPGIRLNAAGGRISLGPAMGNKWTMNNDAPALIRNVAIPAGRIQATMAGGAAEIQGNFSLLIAEETITMQADGHTKVYESGNWSEPMSPYPIGPNPPARYRYYQAIRLDVQSGILRVSAAEHALVWIGQALAVTGNLSASFEGAVGTAAGPDGSRVLDDETISFAGSGQILTWNETAAPSRLRAEASLGSPGAEAGPAAVGGIREATGSNQIRAPNAPPNPWWWVLAGTIAIPTILLLVARVEPWRPDVTDVEWAILTGRLGKARRWGRRLVKRDPSNPDALFLYGSALLQLQDHEALERVVEPLAERIPPRLRMGIAYLLGVSAHVSGKRRRARRWTVEAAREPTLRARMQDDGMLAGARAFTPEDSSAAAYA